MDVKYKKIFIIIVLLMVLLITSFITLRAYADEYQYEGITLNTKQDGFVPYIELAPTGTSAYNESAWHRVFCFNKLQKTPGDGDYRATGRSTYYRSIEGTTDNFNLFADHPQLWGDDNRDHIMSIIYHVYRDKEFNAYGVSNERIDTIVQLAIWYFTDSYDVRLYQGSPNWWAFNMSYAEKSLYDELISISIPDVANSLSLKLYTSDEKNRQNLLDVGDITYYDSPPVPEPAGVQLKVIKKDINTKGLLEGAVFKVVKGYQYSYNSYVSYDEVTQFTTSSDGVSSIMLEPGQYSIIEIKAPEGYQPAEIIYRLDVKKNSIYDATSGYMPIDANDGLVIYNKKAKRLCLAKLVKGTGADKNRYFNFDMALIWPDGSGYSGVLPLESGGECTFIDGHTAFSLKDNDQIMILGIPEGLSYEVSEEPADGYIANIAVNDNSPQEISKVSGKLSDCDTTNIVFTNTNNIVPPTGNHDYLEVYFILFISTAFFIAFFILVCRGLKFIYFSNRKL